MTLGPGCGAYLLVLGVVVFFVDRHASADLPAELRYFVVVPASVLLTTGLSNVWMLVRGYGRGRASRAAILTRAHTGDAPQQDGPIVVTGVARPEGEGLRAPISGVECVAYWYRLYTRQWLRDSHDREVPVYWGYAMRSFRVDAPKQAFRVMAVPQLADPPTQHDSGDARSRAKAYVAATRYEPKRALMGIASATATMLGEFVKEPVGNVRRDWQAEGISVDIDKLLIEEIVVPVGATVSVSGRWSAERRAIVPGEIDEGQFGATLVTGAAEKLGQSGASELPWSALSVALTGTLLLLAGAALVWLATTGQISEWWHSPR